jgi:hypothetical protein
LFNLLFQALAKTAFVHLASDRISAHWYDQDEDWENNVLVLVDLVLSERALAMSDVSVCTAFQLSIFAE